MNTGKKLLSLLTVFCLTLSLVPTVALATTSNATSVTIGGVQMVSGNQVTYYKNSGTSSQTGNATNYNAKYDPVSGTLTLNNLELNNNRIYADGNLTIQLTSNTTSKITNDSNAILVNGNLTIKGPGTLNATGGSWGTAIYANGTITVREGAVISATTTSTSTQAIHSNEIIVTGSGTTVDAISEGNDLAIKANASLFVDDAGKLKVTNTGNATAISVPAGSFSVYKTSGNQVITTRGSSPNYYEADAKSTVATYSVSGNVTDGNSAAIVGASVQLCSTAGTANANASAVIRTSTTTESGTYSFSNVPAGTYTIQVSKVGYTSALTPQQVTVNSDLTEQNHTLTPIQYDVYVAGTRVTGANMNNVLNSPTGTTGTPTVVYTPAREGTPQKLTLNGVNITNTSSDTSATHHSGIEASDNLIIDLKGDNNTISGSGHAINMASGALTITGPGSLEASSNSGQTTVYTNGDVTIKGGAKITATNTSGGNGDVFDLGNSENKHTLTIIGTGTQVIAQKTAGSAVAINHISTLTVNGDATLTAQSNGTAISCDTFTRGVGYTVNVDATNYDGSGATANYQDNSRTAYKYVEVKPGNTTSAGTSYGVWVGNTKVTSNNASNVLSDGKVSYDPATKTLTLKGATITGAANRAYTSAITDACGIYSTHALTINLVGSNTVKGATTSEYGNYGIFVSGKLTFTSDSNGSITVSGGVSINSGNAWVPGVYASGITVNNCNVTVSGGTAKNDTYPVSYAMSTAPTLIGVEVANANTANSAADPSLEYNKSKNSTYKYLQITKKTNADTTVADPVIEPESGYFTGAVAVKMSCLTNGATIYYTTDGSDPGNSTTRQPYNASVTITQNTSIKAIAINGENKSNVVTSTFTKRTDGAGTVTNVTLNLSDQQKTLTVGTSDKLTATVKHDASEIKGLTVTWISDNPDVATVDASGNITAKELGKARITASVTENGTTFSDFCDVIVTAKTQVAITFNANGGTVSPATANTNAYGKLDNLPTPTRSGYSFDGWYTEAEGGTAVTTDTVFDSTAIIYAHWTRNSSGGSHTTYYPVNTPAKSEGGSVVVSQKSASKGSAVTVTVTPESGYQVSSVQAVDKDGKKLTLTDKGDGKYSFVMPGSKVEVSASFAQVQKPEEASPYRDVSKDSYYYDAVQWASDKGITNGVSDGVFAPDWVCTRGQIVTFLWRSVGSPAPKTAEMPFTDVAEDAYYAQAVLWAVENGITKGTSETTFSPDQTCTRAHAVAFLYRLAGSPAVTGSSFQDVTADAYYNAAIAWAVQQGITKGTSETTFSPNETCTRAQIVTFLYRMDQAK